MPTNKRYLYLIIIVTTLIVIGITLRLLTPRTTSTITEQYPALTVPTTGNLYSPTQNIDWSEIATPSLTFPTKLPVYTTQTTRLDETAFQALASNLGFLQPPQVEPTFNLITWENSQAVMNFDQATNLLVYVLNNPQNINSQTPTKTPEQLSEQTLVIIKNIEAIKSLNFALLNSEYLKIDGVTYELTTPTEADFIALTFAPTVNNFIVYTQEQPAFLKATYSTSGVLSKLEIKFHFTNLTQGTATNITPLSNIIASHPDFFRIFIKPQTEQDHYLGVPDLNDLTPNNVGLDYFFDESKRLLLPIYTITRVDQNLTYIYATQAY